MFELERKFLVNKEVSKSIVDSCCKYYQIIEQYYINKDPEIRIRKEVGYFWGAECPKTDYSIVFKYHTDKHGIREEFIIELTEDMFIDLRKKAIGKGIRKYRYDVSNLIDGCKNATLDIFQSPINNLHLLEVEFSNAVEFWGFKKPDWVGSDVTEEAKYYNKNIAMGDIDNGNS